MGLFETLISEVEKLQKRIESLEGKVSGDVVDTTLIGTNVMIKELDVSPSTFNNKILPKLITMKIVKKIGGQYKSRRCDFEQFKMTA